MQQFKVVLMNISELFAERMKLHRNHLLTNLEFPFVAIWTTVVQFANPQQFLGVVESECKYHNLWMTVEVTRGNVFRLVNQFPICNNETYLRIAIIFSVAS